MEHRMRRTDRPAVDSGTQAGIHVPVCDFLSITAAAYVVLSRRRSSVKGVRTVQQPGE